MNRFPFPLRLTVPAILLLLGGLVGGLAVIQQLQVAYQRLEDEGIQRGKLVGLQTSTLLEYLYRHQETQGTESEGALLLMSQLATDKKLELGVLLDATNQVAVATRYEFARKAFDPRAVGLRPAVIDQVRSTQAGQSFLDEATHKVYAVYPIQLRLKPGEIRARQIGVLVLIYNLDSELKGLFLAGLTRAPQDSWVLLLLCGLTWLVFDRLISRRAQQLVAVCDRWEHGQAQERANLGGSDEFAQIGAAFDRMAQRVSESTAALREREQILHDRTLTLERALKELEQTQTQLIQTEKLSSLGQMVAGIAHEVNNPIGFIHGNLKHVHEYGHELLNLVQTYQRYYPDPPPELAALIEHSDLEFIEQDLPKVLASMHTGTDRIRDLVLSLRNFSRLDESGLKPVDLHQGIDNTLVILHNRLRQKGDRPKINVIKTYGKLPLVECHAGQLNQVFAHLIGNALDAFDQANLTAQLPDAPTLWIKTRCFENCTLPESTFPENRTVEISIIDNGPGIEDAVRSRIFDPFFTTKPVGKGTGLGLAISHDIITKTHSGQLICQSAPGKGTTFRITLPQMQPRFGKK